VNSPLTHIPAARSWRDIPQPVKPRAMSRGGQWRLALATARTVGVVLLVGALGWGAWSVFALLRQSPGGISSLAKSVPMRPPELVTTRDGVLDAAWLARMVEFPPGMSLLEVELKRVKARVLADRQVLTATITKIFPDRLVVQITERAPIARLRVAHGETQHDLLVARDGVPFTGTGFDPAMLATLPWLADLSLTPEGVGYQPIAGMDVVARLLADAQFFAPHLYRTWQSVSLARLEDGELEVVNKRGSTAVFDVKLEFLGQLARLDYILDKLATMRPAVARIDLTLGRDLPVRLTPLPASSAGEAPNRPDAPGNLSSILSPLRITREL
jgi:hypothetical protein